MNVCVCMRNLTPSGVQVLRHFLLPSAAAVVVHKRRCHPRRCVVARFSALLVAFVFGFVPANPMPVGTLKQQQQQLQHYTAATAATIKPNNIIINIVQSEKTNKPNDTTAFQSNTPLDNSVSSLRVTAAIDLVAVKPSTLTVWSLNCW